jgi:tRNA threonylcarbamoyladenosine biosynthesis protein TsaB
VSRFIIAVETSSREGSIALAEGDALLADRVFSARAGHARDLHVALDDVFRSCGASPVEVGECYVSIGPGSFTGLRVAVAFARSLALAVGARLAAVPTLEAIASNLLATASPPRCVAVMLPARRGEVFCGVYELQGELYSCAEPVRMASPEGLLRERPGVDMVTGEAVEQYAEVFAARGVRMAEQADWFPRASRVLEIGRRMARAGAFTAARSLAPLYVRRPEAEEVWERRQREG